jgi:hypothetical protein
MAHPANIPVIVAIVRILLLFTIPPSTPLPGLAGEHITEKSQTGADDCVGVRDNRDCKGVGNTHIRGNRRAKNSTTPSLAAFQPRYSRRALSSSSKKQFKTSIFIFLVFSIT